MAAGDMTYYDWAETLTKDAPVTMVVGGRNIGKTFGMRERFLADFVTRGATSVQLCRHQSRVPDVAQGYYDKVCSETGDRRIRRWVEERGPVFRLSRNALLVGYRDGADKPRGWETVTYFAWLSSLQAQKERTFVGVRRLMLDEAVIEPEDMRYGGYLTDEWYRLSSVVNSCSRELRGATPPRVYLLANAVDIINPYFQRVGISEVPARGYHWYDSKRFLLHYVGDDYDRSWSVAETMIEGDARARATAHNAFVLDDETFVEGRTRSARYECGLVCRGDVYGVWTDWGAGVSYVCGDFVPGLGKPMYALTTRDHRVDYLCATEARDTMRALMYRYGRGQLRFETAVLRERFLTMMRDFGVGVVRYA